MSFVSLADNSRTDKNTLHSYLDVYEEILQHKKDTAKRILEVGIYTGGSIKLWRDYFVNATVHGLDIMPLDNVWDVLKNDNRIVLHTSTDAYNSEFFQKTFLDTELKFDMVLDDGPHTLDSMLQFVKKYSQILTDDGVLIVEDVQSIDWIPYLTDATPDNLKMYIDVRDRREIKGRYDDILFIINKSKK